MGNAFINLSKTTLVFGGGAEVFATLSQEVRRNSVTCSPVASFNFLQSTSPLPTIASSINFSARAIHSHVVPSVDPPMKSVSSTRSRSFRRSDLRSGASFLPPSVEELGL